MSRRLDLGVAIYSTDPQQVRRTLQSIAERSVCDIHVMCVHNPCEGDGAVREVLADFANRDQRFVPIWMPTNVGYAGAVNKICESSATEYVAYCDCDVYINTHGWDEVLCGYLDRFHEIGIIFPNGGAYQIQRGAYMEIQWGVGFCWVVNRLCMQDVKHSMYGESVGTPINMDFMDESIGHQNECDLALRVRMCGWKCTAAPEVSVSHEAKSTNSPASVERISRGVMDFVNKWCRYFGGKNLNYHSPNVLRWEDWPPNALYMEEWWALNKPGLNANPEVINVQGREYDLIRVPRFKDFYRGRTI